LALARRVLTLVIATAVALAPLGAVANAATHMHAAPMAAQSNISTSPQTKRASLYTVT